MNKIKYIIVGIVIIIILIIISIIFINKKPNPVQNIITEEKIEESEYKNISDASKVFNVSNCISIYFDKINKNNSSYFGRNASGQEEKVVEESTIKKGIYNILSKEYIKQNNIKEEDVYTYVPNLDKKTIFVPLEMTSIKSGNIEKYAVHGFIEDLNYNYISDIYIIINFDTQNNTFSIEPTKNQNKELKELEQAITFKSIETNVNNKVDKIQVNEQYICTQYLYMYKRIALAKPEIAYNILNKEYREKRFENIENYKKYIESNKDTIKALTLNQYLINQDKTEYVCKDKNENLYIFNVTDGILNYTTMLDTYTIPTQEYIDKYKEANEEGKVDLNINKIVQMINNKDYLSIYRLLDDEFKKNKFETEGKFEEYMKKYYQKYYTHKEPDLQKDGNVYIIGLKLTDIHNKEKSLNSMNIMMLLKENTDFKISFTHIEELNV